MIIINIHCLTLKLEHHNFLYICAENCLLKFLETEPVVTIPVILLNCPAHDVRDAAIRNMRADKAAKRFLQLIFGEDALGMAGSLDGPPTAAGGGGGAGGAEGGKSQNGGCVLQLTKLVGERDGFELHFAAPLSPLQAFAALAAPGGWVEDGLRGRPVRPAARHRPDPIAPLAPVPAWHRKKLLR